MRRALLTVAFAAARSPRPPPQPRSSSTRPPTPARAVREQPCSLRGGARPVRRDARSRHDHRAGRDVPAQWHAGRARRRRSGHDHGRGARTDGIEGAGTTRVFGVTGQENRFIGLTIAGGRELFDTGGNVVIGHGAALELDHVRITDGIAARGGGIATGGGGSLIVRHSLIDNNEARTARSSSGDGGGHPRDLDGQPADARGVGLDDRVQPGLARGGLQAERSARQRDDARSASTIADNAATGARGGGHRDPRPGARPDRGLDHRPQHGQHRRPPPWSSALRTAARSCRPAAAGTSSPATDCGLERQNTTGGLATALADNGGQTPTSARCRWTSDVHDFAGACTAPTSATSPRPQGAGCDPGAYEAQPPPPPEATPIPTPTAIPTTVPTPTPTVTPAPTPVTNRTIVVAPGARHGPGEGARSESIREAGRHEGHPGRLDRGHAQGPRHAHVDPQGRARRRRPPRSTTGSSGSRSRAGSPT